MKLILQKKLPNFILKIRIMSKYKILFLIVFIFCGGGYIDTSYEDDVIYAVREVYENNVSNMTDEEILERELEICEFYYRDYEIILESGDAGFFIIDYAYQDNRNMGLSPYESEMLLEAELNYCGFSSNYASLDTDILLCMYEYDYQVYYLGNIDYDDTSIPCEK